MTYERLPPDDDQNRYSYSNSYQMLQRLSAIETQLITLLTQLSATATQGNASSGDIADLRNKVDAVTKEVQQLKLEVTNNSMIANVVRWLGAAVAGTAIALLVSAYFATGGN